MLQRLPLDDVLWDLASVSSLYIIAIRKLYRCGYRAMLAIPTELALLYGTCWRGRASRWTIGLTTRSGCDITRILP